MTDAIEEMAKLAAEEISDSGQIEHGQVMSHADWLREDAAIIARHYRELAGDIQQCVDAAVQAERGRCANIAEQEARQASVRCDYAAKAASARIAAAIRSGEKPLDNTKSKE